TSRAGRPGINPGFDQFAELLLRAGRRLAAFSGRPTPPDQRIFGHVVDEFSHGFSAVARGVLDLLTDLTERLAEPRHLDRRQVPLRMSGHLAGVEVCLAMACRAPHADGPHAILS